MKLRKPISAEINLDPIDSIAIMLPRHFGFKTSAFEGEAVRELFVYEPLKRATLEV